MTRRTGLADAYARYADLITAQIDAIESGDHDVFVSLTQERDQVARDIDGMHAEDPVSSAETAREERPRLEAALAADVQLREKLSAIQHESLDGARSIDRNRDAIRSYGAPAETGARLDLSL